MGHLRFLMGDVGGDCLWLYWKKMLLYRSCSVGAFLHLTQGLLFLLDRSMAFEEGLGKS